MKLFYLLCAIAGAVIPYSKFIVYEGKRANIRNLWAPIAATCLVGVSCGLPLFLYLREARLEAKE